MALWTHKRFATLEQALDYLNGAMIGTVNLNAGALVDGLTFIIHDGIADRTTTFAPAKSRAWTIQEIVAQINATPTLGDVASAVIKTPRAGAGPVQYLRIFGDPNHTIRGNGTANTVLGFDAPATPANDTVQVKILDTAVAYFRQINRDPNRQWEVIHYS
jgi:hypothetical protein